MAPLLVVVVDVAYIQYEIGNCLIASSSFFLESIRDETASAAMWNARVLVNKTGIPAFSILARRGIRIRIISLSSDILTPTAERLFSSVHMASEDNTFMVVTLKGFSFRDSIARLNYQIKI